MFLAKKHQSGAISFMLRTRVNGPLHTKQESVARKQLRRQSDRARRFDGSGEGDVSSEPRTSVIIGSAIVSMAVRQVQDARAAHHFVVLPFHR
jgi:hypothetical protein